MSVDQRSTRSSDAETREAEPPTRTRNPQVMRWRDLVWSNWWFGYLLAAVAAAGVALVLVSLMPRGPISTADAFLTVGVGLLVGFLSSVSTGSRWSLLLTPVVLCLTYEMGRLALEGPTVDGIHLDSSYGVIAFVVGRGLHGFLLVLPMILGGMLGLWQANRLGHPSTPHTGVGGWVGIVILAVVLGLSAVQLARQASTAPILGPDGQPLPGSVAELATLTIGGEEQAVLIRGRSTDSSVLLYLAGGPGGTDIGAMRGDVGLEEEFVVATWDQRGVGKSYSALNPVDEMTVDQLVSDTIELTNYLRARFDEEKIYVVGNSWGSALGVMAIGRHPELYHAFVGVGQMVSMRETDVMFWEDSLRWAEETANTSLAGQLTANGPPPYENILAYEPAVSHEHDWNAYPGLDVSNEMPSILFVPEYTWMERFNGFRSFLDTFAVMYPQLQDLDFRVDVSELEVPVYIVLGQHEARGRATLANEWFNMLDAPTKEKVVFQGAGHRAHFDQPQAFAEFMTSVKNDTYPTQGGTGR